MPWAGASAVVASWMLGLPLAACSGEAVTGPTWTGAGNGTAVTSSEGGTSTTSSSTSHSSTSSLGGEGGAGAGGSGGGSGGSSGGSALDAHTELDGPVLVLHCNLPREVGECAESGPPGVPCADDDGDGLTDRWEELIIDRFRPLVRFDENESLLGDPAFVTAMVARVAPAGDALVAFMMLGYSRDYGSCGGLSAHNGDSERVVVELVPEPDGGACDVRVNRAYTAAHEGTVTDHGRVFEGAALGELVHAFDPSLGEPRWVVFSSENKHATYASEAICEGISDVPCFDEDCGADGAPDPETFERLFPFVNAGEELAPFVTDLGPIGFAGEDAWADQDFCGGLGGILCASPVREKLLASPF
jgi:hypothetical protein